MLIALCLGLASPGSSAPDLQGSSTPRLEAEDLEGRRTELPLRALPLSDPREKGAWILRPSGFPANPPGDEASEGPLALVTLVNGDELQARVRGGEGETLRLELFGGVVVPFELSHLSRLTFPEVVSESQRLALVPAPEGDRLVRRTAALDALDGTLEGFEEDGVRFDSVLGQRTIPWEEVGALFIEALEEHEPKDHPLVPVVIGFAGPGGGRVRGGLVALERTGCRMLLGGNTEVSIPLFALSEIVVADGRLTFLSELSPTSEVGRGAPFGDDLGMSWPHRMDRNALGGELRSGGVVHRHGIGMHAPTAVSFTLDGAYRTLRGRVAIDDGALVQSAHARGSVLFRVRADGESLWESALVRGGDPPQALPALDLTGRRELVLEVDSAGDFAGDRANWLDLILVR